MATKQRKPSSTKSRHANVAKFGIGGKEKKVFKGLWHTQALRSKRLLRVAAEELIDNTREDAIQHSIEVKLGSVTLKTVPPQDDLVRERINEAARNLASALSDLSHPGIKLEKKKGIPYFKADPNDPTLLIRKLNGTETRGRFDRGTFVEL